MNTLAEIPARSSRDVRAGTLRSSDLGVFRRLLEAQYGNGAVLVTGAGDGPLVVSTGLASAAAARGTNTALIECDLRNPALADALGLEQEPGLNEYLRQEAEAPDVLQPLVLAGPASAQAKGPLICIVAGRPDEDAAGSELGADSLRHALTKLRHAYDLLVVHGPTLGDESGALRTAAEGADRVLACVGPALVEGREGRRLKKSIRRLPAESVGVVVYGGAGSEDG